MIQKLPAYVTFKVLIDDHITHRWAVEYHVGKDSFERQFASEQDAREFLASLKTIEQVTGKEQ